MLGQKKILIVDDQPKICEFLTDSLRQHGYDTAVAMDGQKGLEEMERFKPDLVLLDIMMPVMDGWEMLVALRAKEKKVKTPVIMLTAKSNTEALIKSQQYQVTDYFIKPINMPELLAFIKRYIK